MKIGISGSRRITDYRLFSVYMDTFGKHVDIDMIIAGGATGIDELAYKYAVERGITFVCHPPKLDEGIPQKFFRRNLRIVEQGDVLVAFPDDSSKGTWHAINLAKKLQKPVYIMKGFLTNGRTGID